MFDIICNRLYRPRSLVRLTSRFIKKLFPFARGRVRERNERTTSKGRSTKGELKEGFWQSSAEINGTEYIPVQHSTVGPGVVTARRVDHF